MIDKNVVARIVEEWLEDKSYFLVDVNVSPDDKIVVEIDHAEGVWIDDCVELSRYIESKLSREEEDYELEVGSAGIGQPFKVLQQYVARRLRSRSAGQNRKEMDGCAGGCQRREFYGYGRSENKTGRCQASEAGGTECNLYL